MDVLQAPLEVDRGSRSYGDCDNEAHENASDQISHALPTTQNRALNSLELNYLQALLSTSRGISFLFLKASKKLCIAIR